MTRGTFLASAVTLFGLACSIALPAAATCAPGRAITGSELDRFAVLFNGRPLHFEILYVTSSELMIPAARSGDLQDEFADLIKRMNAEAEVDPDQYSLLVSAPGVSMRFLRDKPVLNEGTQTLRLVATPCVYQEYLLIPLRPLVEALGGYVHGGIDSREVDISYSYH